MRSLVQTAAMCVGMATGLHAALAGNVNITASRDATLYFDSLGATANGAGSHLFAGVVANGSVRRGLLGFDLSSIPAGSTITSVSMTLHMSRSIQTMDAAFSLHRVTSNWGEGASDAEGPEGIPALAQPGDATWLHTFFADGGGTLWNTPGGDFVGTASASKVIGADEGFYSFTSTPELVADVQAWLDAPANNFGWLLRGDELNQPTAKRFDSRENPDQFLRPTLQVTFIPGPSAGVVLLCAGVIAARRRRG
jgi:hypothetical protein